MFKFVSRQQGMNLKARGYRAIDVSSWGVEPYVKNPAG
jgi:hypothetical protein